MVDTDALAADPADPDVGLLAVDRLRSITGSLDLARAGTGP